MHQTCVHGHNIIKYKKKSVEECRALCNQMGGKCKAFEYGVKHSGHNTYKPGDCQLQSSNKYGTCNGKYYNLDLYIKSPKCYIKNMSKCSHYNEARPHQGRYKHGGYRGRQSVTVGGAVC